MQTFLITWENTLRIKYSKCWTTINCSAHGAPYKTLKECLLGRNHSRLEDLPKLAKYCHTGVIESINALHTKEQKLVQNSKLDICTKHPLSLMDKSLPRKVSATNFWNLVLTKIKMVYPRVNDSKSHDDGHWPQRQHWKVRQTTFQPSFLISWKFFQKSTLIQKWNFQFS